MAKKTTKSNKKKKSKSRKAGSRQIIHTSGKRKKSIAKATLRPGKGLIKINNKNLDILGSSLYFNKIREPLWLAGDLINKVDITVRVRGGGINGQAEAARLAISKALVGFEQKLEKVFTDYDRHLLVADVRNKETRKPNTHGKARAKEQFSKR